MERQSIGLKILWWAEVVIAARVLLFSVPVIINRGLSKGSAAYTATDLFIMFITFASLLYLIVGIVSIMGYRSRQLIHYAAAVFILFLTAGLANISVSSKSTVPFIYVVPALFSIIVAVLNGFLKPRSA